MNHTSSPLSPSDSSNNAQPTALYITQGSFGIMSTVELRGDILYFSAASYSEEETIGRLNPKRWQSFRQTLESLQAEQWQPHYINAGVLDGHQWKVKIEYADGLLIEASGGNAYPVVLDLDYTVYGKQS
ncbi:MAG: hypothetical protein P8R37_10245, partial [Opitutae bacterium]|nr:hypothetical protein [Opitutae bacterium]